MSQEQKKRLREITKPVLQTLAIGLLYFVFVIITGWALPCPIRLVTGKYCPGCGVTRMLLAMLRLDFEAAFYANRLLFFLLPLILIYSFIKAVCYIRTGKNRQTRFEQIATILILLLTVAFWILRNTEAFSFLAPIG